MTPHSTAQPRLPATMRFIERDWLSANGIFFDDGRSTALIDTGYIKHRDMTLAVLRELLGQRPLDQIINTHLHSDHCGGNALLQRTYRSRTLIPAASAPAVRGWDRTALSFERTGQRCEPFTIDGTIDDGDELRLGGLLWEVIAAPGHDPHAVVLYCASHRLLISADALWQNGFGVIFPELEGESGFAEQRAILERIASLDVDVVLPGHGPLFTNISEAIEHAHRRLDHLGSDPARNARHATKVLLKFLLLEHEQLALDAVPALLDTIPLIDAANRRYIGMPADELARWAVDELVRAGAARIDSQMLIDA